LNIQEISNAIVDDQAEENNKKDLKTQSVSSTDLPDNEGEVPCTSVDNQLKKRKKRKQKSKDSEKENLTQDLLTESFKSEEERCSVQKADLKLKKCPQCDYKAIKASHIRRHVESKHDGITFGCDKCELRFSNQSNLQKHVKVVHLGMRFNCYACDYQNGQKVNLQNHMKSKHDMLIKDEY